ncbi:MAG: trypsin-like peptidase domain-containing protein [Planctomycetales bacterium]|nr:trypsin-like peptidase domain-containing protein [Planctomycetales bacterium]
MRAPAAAWSAAAFQRGEAQGSGFLFRDEGYVLTNYHVVRRAREVGCEFAGGTRVRGTVVGVDAPTDLAVVRIGEKDLPATARPAPIGDPEKLEAGDFVIALGAPAGMSETLTAGIVSHPRRYLPGIGFEWSGLRTGFLNLWIQTDAPINRGNSGGPLVNVAGEVVGVNSREAAGVDGIGYAIPIGFAREIATKLIESGRVARSFLGADFGLDDGGRVVVRMVMPSTPAEEAGIRTGDVLEQLAGDPVSIAKPEEIPAFFGRLASAAADQPLAMRLARGSESLDVLAVPREAEPYDGQFVALADVGLTLRVITKSYAEAAKPPARRGVSVVAVAPQSRAQRAGLAPGEVIVRAGTRDVADAEDLLTAFAVARQTARWGARVALTVRRGGGDDREIEMEVPAAVEEGR